MNTHAIPDLGALAHPQQQIQVVASVLARSTPAIPPELVDANGLVEMILAGVRPLVHTAVREELERMGLVAPDA